VSAQNEDRATRDLELTTDEADSVKGGVIPGDPGGAALGRAPAGHKRKKRRKRNLNIGPYKGKH
jgi:hypothetical protein